MPTTRQGNSMNPRLLRALKRAGKRTIWRYTSNRPAFMIIGAQKCGTTSLHKYLGQHPRLYSGMRKELHFFDEKMHFGTTEAWYEKQFHGPRDALFYESSPSYLYRPGIAQTLHEYSRDLKFIVILRDPAKRAYSSYLHHKKTFDKKQIKISAGTLKNRPAGDAMIDLLYKGRTHFPSLKETLEIELNLMAKQPETYEPALLRRGLYLGQLQNYWDTFGRDRVLILGFREFTTNPLPCLQRVADFLGIAEFREESLDLRPHNVRSNPEPIAPEDEALLNSFFETPNRQLLEEIGPLAW